MQSMGSNAQHIAVIAVSMDPKGDTPLPPKFHQRA
jgi:hypothetical protein